MDRIGAVLLDGPLGTELQRRGIDTVLPLWSARALLDAPETVIAIHREYLEAGADVVTTNSFRTNARVIDRAGMKGKGRELTALSVQLARLAIEEEGKENVLIAGSDAPVEDCYSPELVPDDKVLYEEHREHIEWLVEAGCDVILIETINQLREAVAAAEAARDVGTPFLISLVTDPTGVMMLGNDRLEDAVRLLTHYDPVAILTNCSAPNAILKATKILADVRRRTEAEWMFGGYANSGEPDPVMGWEFVHTVPVNRFVESVREMKRLDASVFGSCCGTTPEYIRALHTMIYHDQD